MADIKCVVCGEPWDAYGVTHGDMLKWEADLFKRGAGCPSCKGISPNPEWEPETIEDIDNGDEDPAERLELIENRDNRPKWEPPPPTLLYKCDCCNCEVFKDDSEENPDSNIVIRGGEYANRYRLEKLEDSVLKEPYRINDQTICPACIEFCDECGAKICGSLSTDTYDGLASFNGSHIGRSFQDTFCYDCYETLSSAYESDEDLDGTAEPIDDEEGNNDEQSG